MIPNETLCIVIRSRADGMSLVTFLGTQVIVKEANPVPFIVNDISGAVGILFEQSYMCEVPSAVTSPTKSGYWVIPGACLQPIYPTDDDVGEERDDLDFRTSKPTSESVY